MKIRKIITFLMFFSLATCDLDRDDDKYKTVYVYVSADAGQYHEFNCQIIEDTTRKDDKKFTCLFPSLRFII